MSSPRLPKVGEVWRSKLNATSGASAEIQSAYPDAVVYLFRSHDDEEPGTHAEIPERFVQRYRPPEPTVVSSRFLVIDDDDPTRFYVFKSPEEDDANVHRLDLMSDGEFRVVKL